MALNFPNSPSLNDIHIVNGSKWIWDGDKWIAGTSEVGLIGATGATGPVTAGIVFVIDGAGSAITSGIKGDVSIPFNATITDWTLLADVTGYIAVDVYKDTYANFPPTAGDAITGASSAKPILNTVNKNTNSTLSGWTTTVTAGDILRFNVDTPGATSITKATIVMKITKT